MIISIITLKFESTVKIEFDDVIILMTTESYEIANILVL